MEVSQAYQSIAVGQPSDRIGMAESAFLAVEAATRLEMFTSKPLPHNFPILVYLGDLGIGLSIPLAEKEAVKGQELNPGYSAWEVYIACQYPDCNRLS